MDRRRFIVTAISAAAVGAALATDACSPGRGVPGSAPGTLGEAGIDAAGAQVLNVRYTITNIAGYKLRGRTYNGKTYGPTIVTRPGDTLKIKIVNQLPPNPLGQPPEKSVPIPLVHTMMEAMNPHPHGPTVASGPIDPMNNPHDFNTTNLHVHGIQTVPHLFDPVGTSDPAAEMIRIEPGSTKTYSFPVPKDHPSGLHWYHPHNHGSTDVQVSNGMAGLIVVRGPIDKVPEIAAAREIFFVVQTLDVNPSKTRPGIYEREYISYRQAANGGYSLGTDFTMITVNGQGCQWVDNTKNVYKQVGRPQFTVQPGEIVRLRFLNGTNYLPLFLTLPGFQAWAIGFDGVNTLTPIVTDMSGSGVKLITPKNLLTAPIRLAASANRIEMLLQAPSTPGTYTLSTLASDKVHFVPTPTFGLADFVVSGSPVTMGIPSKLPVPTREYPVITAKDVVAKRKFIFEEGNNSTLLTGFGFTINGVLYQMDECPFAPQVGTAEEWRIENTSPEEHPFHLHTNSFQLIAINDIPNSPMEVWDTFMVPPKFNGKNGSITFRVRFLEWYGKDVFHCHVLPHEDTGMMQNFLLV